MWKVMNHYESWNAFWFNGMWSCKLLHKYADLILSQISVKCQNSMEDKIFCIHWYRCTPQIIGIITCISFEIFFYCIPRNSFSHMSFRVVFFDLYLFYENLISSRQYFVGFWEPEWIVFSSLLSQISLNSKKVRLWKSPNTLLFWSQILT